MTRLRKLVVSAEPWQVFLVFVGVIVFNGIVKDHQETLKIIAYILLSVVIFGWFLVLGTSLNDNLPEDEQKSATFYVICCCYGIFAVSSSSILETIPIDTDFEPYAIAASISFCLAGSYIFYFASTVYFSNQERFLDKDRLSAGATFILFIVFIVGVLVFQSRVKKIFH